ncbi:MAG: CopC protein [Aeromicrobium sp.]|jgi:methionine-rich copper-binding protein CopC|nr:CopC protein [Aeromicrobium sp.]
MLFSVRSLLVVALASTVIGAGASAGSAATGGSNPPIATVPAVGSQISAEPSSVTLAMRTAVTGPAVVTVKDGSGRVVSEGSTTLLSTNIAVDLKTGLAKGVYTVTYRIDGGPTTGPEGGVFQFAYGSGTPTWKISTWSGYKNIPKETRLPDDAKREAAFEAAASGKGTPSATPTTSDTNQTSADPTKTSDETDSGGHAWLWFVVIALALVGGGGAAYVASRRRAETAPSKHAESGVSPPPDET